MEHQLNLSHISDKATVLNLKWLDLTKKKCDINQKINRLLLFGVPGMSEDTYKEWKNEHETDLDQKYKKL